MLAHDLSRTEGGSSKPKTDREARSPLIYSGLRTPRVVRPLQLQTKSRIATSVRVGLVFGCAAACSQSPAARTWVAVDWVGRHASSYGTRPHRAALAGENEARFSNDQSHACLHRKDQNPLMMLAAETVQSACKAMCERCVGSVLVIDDQQRLIGIFTGRDAVRTLVQGKSVGRTTLDKAMTPNPVTVTPDQRRCRRR